MSVTEFLNDICNYLTSQHEAMKYNNMVTAQMEEYFKVICQKMSLFGLTRVPEPPDLPMINAEEVEIEDSTSSSINNEDSSCSEGKKDTDIEVDSEVLSQPINMTLAKTPTNFHKGDDSKNSNDEVNNQIAMYQGFTGITDEIKVTNCNTRLTKKPQCKRKAFTPMKTQQFLPCVDTDLINYETFSQSPEKRYQCGICNKIFKRGSNLNRHMFIHTGGKTFNCKECSKEFTRKSDLSRHMRLHTGEKPFQCNTCEKGFNQKAHLKKHMLSHDRKLEKMLMAYKKVEIEPQPNSVSEESDIL